MTRTTELLKENERNAIANTINIYSRDRMDILNEGIEKGYSKGRLDALKEEVEWLNENSPRDQYEKLHPVYADRLASIQEEIKLIEEGI